MSVVATAGTFGWQKLHGAEVDGALEFTPDGRSLLNRRRLDLGEARFTFHGHDSGYTQACVRVSTGCVSVLDAPGVSTPIVGVGRNMNEARLDAKHKARALGFDVKGLANG